MNSEQLSRRRFLEQTAVAAGAVAIASKVGIGQEATTATPAPAAAAVTGAAKRTAQDIVALGDSGLKCTRLGIGLGSSNGQQQAAGGQEKFNGFVKHAVDQGITMFDTASNYATFNMMGPAIKGMPREKIFIQSKIEQPRNILDEIDRHRKAFNSDYVDSMLVHIQFRENWVETWKAALEDYNKALEKKWIKAKGISCHSLPALRAAVKTDWTQIHLVRVNPLGIRTDTEQQVQEARGANDIKPVLAELKNIHEKKRGVIGMKIFGGGDAKFNNEAEREKSMRFVMAMPEVHSIIIGFTSTDQMDATIKMMNSVLADLG